MGTVRMESKPPAREEGWSDTSVLRLEPEREAAEAEAEVEPAAAVVGEEDGTSALSQLVEDDVVGVEPVLARMKIAGKGVEGW